MVSLLIWHLTDQLTIFEAIAGIYHRNTRASARFLRELNIHNDDADVLHEKLLALASRMGFLLNAADIAAKEVYVLLNIPFLLESKMNQYVAGDNEQTDGKPLHEKTSAVIDNRTSLRDGTSISQSPYKTTCKRDQSSSPTQEYPCALLRKKW